MKGLFKVKSTKKNPYFNHEGYADPTAYHGMKNIVKEEELIAEQVSDIIHVIWTICRLAGFEVVGRITLRHKKSGREFE